MIPSTGFSDLLFVFLRLLEMAVNLWAPLHRLSAVLSLFHRSHTSANAECYSTTEISYHHSFTEPQATNLVSCERGQAKGLEL